MLQTTYYNDQKKIEIIKIKQNTLEQNENQLHQMILKEQKLLIDKFGFYTYPVPNMKKFKKSKILSKKINIFPSCNIFLSNNWKSCNKLILILVNGSGIRPGIWSRSLILDSVSNNTNLFRKGSMLPYIYGALSRGYGMIIPNPNENSIIVNDKKMFIPYSSTPEEHITYVYNQIIKKNTNNIPLYIISYANGGSLALHLLQTQPSIHGRIISIAFIESNHRISSLDGYDEVKDLIRTKSINWKRSNVPSGMQIVDGNQDLGCISISVGDNILENRVQSSNIALTINLCTEMIFSFFKTAKESSMINHLSNYIYLNNYDKNTIIQLNDININQFEFISFIGKGGYGKVYLVRKKKNFNTLYAMKILNKNDISNKSQIENIKCEERILKYAVHPFLVRLRYAFQNQYRLFLVMDYYKNRSLYYHLSQMKRFDERRAKFYTSEIIVALSYLHSLNIMYRDLKLENILLDTEGHVALTDFGLAKENITGTSFVGTPDYLAPELLLTYYGNKNNLINNKNIYTNTIDWWSLGILVYEMINGKTPFYDSNRMVLFNKILSEHPIYDKKLFSPLAIDFINSLLVKNPKSRLGCGRKGATEIMEHPWLHGIDWNMIFTKEYRPPVVPPVHSDISINKNNISIDLSDTSDDGLLHNNDMMLNDNINMHFDNFTFVNSEIETYFPNHQNCIDFFIYN